MTALLSVNQVTVQFGGVYAINDFSFRVDPGELVGFIGPNGAGKTTMMRTLTGTVTPTSGSVILDGQCLDGMPIHHRVRCGLGLAQQLVRPFTSMTVLENVALACGHGKTARPWISLFTVSRATEHRQAAEILDRFDLGEVSGEPAALLPLGLRKRLEVARAIALQPKLLLLDEPLAGLNQGEARDMADTITHIRSRGITVILIEHNLGEVIRICPRLVVQDHGQKIADGDTRAVMANPVVQHAYVGGRADA